MDDIRKGKFKITIEYNISGMEDRVYSSPEYVIEDEKTVDFDNKAYQNLIKSLIKNSGTEEKYIRRTSHYNDLLSIYPYVREFFASNISKACIKDTYMGMGVIRSIELQIFIELGHYIHTYTSALYARIDKDGSSIRINWPFQEQEVPNEEESKENYNKVEEENKKDKDSYLSQNTNVLILLLSIIILWVLIGLMAAVKYFIS